MWNSSIWPIDRTLSNSITPGPSGPESDGNEGVLCIPQISSMIGAWPSDCLVSYPGYSLGDSYPSPVMLSVYSASTSERVILSGETAFYEQTVRINNNHLAQTPDSSMLFMGFNQPINDTWSFYLEEQRTNQESYRDCFEKCFVT